MSRVELISDDELATILADIEKEDARARENGEAHGNYGEDFGMLAYDLVAARERVRRLEAVAEAARYEHAPRRFNGAHVPCDVCNYLDELDAEAP